MQQSDAGPAFGLLLRRYREAAGLTQEALAERAGLSARSISDLERGIHRAPRGDTLGLLVRGLGLGAQDRIRLEGVAHRYDGSGAAAVDAGAQPHDDTQPALAGRAAELALIERHLAREGPPILVLAGEPGIGKSRLLRQAVYLAPAMGWRVLLGGCQRQGGQEPYAPVL